MNNAELKIADFGLATVIEANKLERMKCGSPGFVAPEMLNDEGYDTKADIFSAGIILCMILTGVSPFYDKCYENILLKNKEAIIDFKEPHWILISEEAKNLVRKMVTKEPEKRCTAAEALQDPWFSLERTDLIILSNAQENMRKYCNNNRFDVSKIKPQFSMITCTPLLNSRFTGKDSPLLIPTNNTLSRRLAAFYDKERTQVQKLVAVGDANDFSDDSSVDDSANFEEKEMDEQMSKKGSKFMLTSRIPPTSGFSAEKSLTYLKHWATPLQKGRAVKNATIIYNKESYLGKLFHPTSQRQSNEPVAEIKNGHKCKPEEELIFTVNEAPQESQSDISNTNKEDEEFVTAKSHMSLIGIDESEDKKSFIHKIP